MRARGRAVAAHGAGSEVISGGVHTQLGKVVDRTPVACPDGWGIGLGTKMVRTMVATIPSTAGRSMVSRLRR